MRRFFGRSARALQRPSGRGVGGLLGGVLFTSVLAASSAASSLPRADPAPDFGSLPPTVASPGRLLRLSASEVALALHCTGSGACDGVVQVLWRRPVHHGRGRTRTLVLGRGSFTASGGDDLSVTIDLNGLGLRALRPGRSRHLVVSAHVTLSDGFALSVPAVPPS